jgi:transposase
MKRRSDVIDGKLCCGRCWPGSGANHAFARWSCRYPRMRKIAGAPVGNVPSCFEQRIRHVNRVKGLLSGQGIVDYEPLERDRLARLDELRTGDGRPLPSRLRAELLREIEVIELLLRQIADVEAERDADGGSDTADQPSPVATLMRLKAVGPQIAATLYGEGPFPTFTNRREVAAYAGLVPTPWRSGTIAREQGISKAGNRRLRTAMIELAWLWVRHQPDSQLTRLIRARVGEERGRARRIAIVALARKLLIALWRYVSHGELPEGLVMKLA